MKSKLLLIVLLLILTGFFLGFGKILLSKTQPQKIVTANVEVKPTKKVNQPTPTPTPSTNNFDRSTDLKEELSTINPEVKNGDFQALEEIISSF